MTAPTILTPAISRSIDHRYTYEGITYPGVTSIIDIVGGSFGAASGWGAKQAAMAAVRMADDLPKMIANLGEEGTRKALCAKSAWGPDPSGSILGTAVHEAIEKFLTVSDFEMPGGEVSRRLRFFADWWASCGWRLRLSEAMVVHPSHENEQDGWGGTFDLLAYDRDGRTVCADIKTGNLYPKVALQLAAYGMASLVQPANDHRAYPMPLPDRYVVLHVTESGLREVEIAVGTAERMAFLAALDIYHWTESMKGKRL